MSAPARRATSSAMATAWEVFLPAAFSFFMFIPIDFFDPDLSSGTK